MANEPAGSNCALAAGIAGLVSLGLFFTAVALAVPDLDGKLFALAMGLPNFVGAWAIWDYTRKRRRQLSDQRNAQLERAILEVAQANDGLVTPAMVTMSARDIDLDTAGQHLDAMVTAGHCDVEYDEGGRPSYHFNLRLGHSATDTQSADTRAWRIGGRDRRRLRGTEDERDTVKNRH